MWGLAVFLPFYTKAPSSAGFSFSSNLNINDVLGNYSLTLVDALDTLAVSPASLAF